MCIRNLARNGHQRALYQLNKCFFAYFISGTALTSGLRQYMICENPATVQGLLILSLQSRTPKGARSSISFRRRRGKMNGDLKFRSRRWDGRNWGRIFFFSWANGQKINFVDSQRLTERLAQSTEYLYGLPLGRLVVQFYPLEVRCRIPSSSI